MSIVRELIERNRAGETVGLPCFCTANEHVLQSILRFTAQSGFPTVIEATCNQVNQEGGYTGMTAADFMAWLGNLATRNGVSLDQITVGGDHLGPNPWRTEPITQAMDKARALVKSYVEAGFTKIHLDASMACGGEPPPRFSDIAARSADLCAVAEAYAPDPEKLMYIIGTEVPIPGGETEEPDALDVTSVERFQATIETHRDAFDARGLDAAWHRIVSVVTQPGVDFGHSSIYPFEAEKASHLRGAISTEPGLSFEAHSTDYQSTSALTDLVASHFFFLKVGPELTFRFREAVWALAQIESTLRPDSQSRVCETVLRRMAESPLHWQDYYSGSEQQIGLQKVFSYSDRVRYYWADPEVQSALTAMLLAFEGEKLPESLISQAFMGFEFGAIPTDARSLIDQHIQRSVERYFQAAGFSRKPS